VNKIFELIAEALFVFWFAGCWAVLLDIDHVWIRLGRNTPVDFTHWPGRGLHHPIIFLVFSIVVGCFVFAPVYGLYVQISGQVGTLGRIFGGVAIIAGTMIFLKWFDKKNKVFLDE